MLLSCEADPNQASEDGETPLHHAAYRGDSGMLELLLSYGANPDVPNRESKRTPFHYSAIVGNLNCIEVLLSHNANTQIEDSMGNKPSDLASHDVSALIESISKFANPSPKEPESEMSNTKKSELAHLYDFLRGIKLEEYFD